MESADLLWAVEECGRAEFGDLRLTHRMAKVTAALAAQPAASIPTALQGWGETKGAYRFFANPKVRRRRSSAPMRRRRSSGCGARAHPGRAGYDGSQLYEMRPALRHCPPSNGRPLSSRCTNERSSRDSAHPRSLPPSPPVIYIGRLGGFLARKGDGDPGVKTIWRGWQSLQDRVAMLEAAQLSGLLGKA